jgi:predicted ATPase
MAEASRQSLGMLRKAVESHRGYVFKTVGDACCASFWVALDAAGAAVAAQRAVAAQEWKLADALRVRIALHSGSTDERDGDYFGPAVNRVARLLAVAHGGQVVVSGSTASLLRGLMAQECELLDLGEHRLKDLAEPERVWQLCAPGLCETFPALRSLGSMPNNLPRQFTPLIGRDDVVETVEALVRKSPLVTLVGTGGVGKTRVALQVAADLLDAFADGAWFVELAPVRDAAHVAGTIASALGLAQQADHPVAETLLRYVKKKRLLLVLDNCEHVIDEAARVAASILAESKDVRMLATSREPLRVTGELVYRLPSLDAADALALFVARAALSNREFVLIDSDAPIVAEICARLDGIPFAIELAAARLRILSPSELARRLDERFRILSGGSRNALPRHQTMHALIDWSFDLLTPKEQRVFRRLAIFAGGWTFSQVAPVCLDRDVPEDAVEEWELLDIVAGLVDKSLIVARLDDSVEQRYEFLESMRAYAREKLESAGERQQIAQRHAELMAGIARDATSDWTASGTTLKADLENLRAAISWCLARPKFMVLAAEIVRDSQRLLFQQSRREALEYAQRILQDPEPLDDVLLAQMWRLIGNLTDGAASLEACDNAVRLLEARNEKSLLLARTYRERSRALAAVGRLSEALEVNTVAIALHEELGATDPYNMAHMRLHEGRLLARQGESAAAAGAFHEASRLFNAAGDSGAAAVARINEAETHLFRGETTVAIDLARDALHAARQNKQPYYEALAISSLASYRLCDGDLGGASDLGEAFEAAQKTSDPPIEAFCILSAALRDALQAEHESAAKLSGYVRAWCSATQYLDPCMDVVSARIDVLVRRALAPERLDALEAEGARLSAERAWEIAKGSVRVRR